ncbi:hypothetical protein Tco_0882877 [Tanacetum coccineum]
MSLNRPNPVLTIKGNHDQGNNGNQARDSAFDIVSAPKTSLAANARRNNEKALNILLSAIPDRHLLSFHDAVDARSLWKAIKAAQVLENEASKKNAKESVETQFETFTTKSRAVLFKQSTAEPTNIPKGYTQAASSKVPTAPNYASHSDEIICSFFSQQASMPTTHDDEDLLQIIDDGNGRN